MAHPVADPASDKPSASGDLQRYPFPRLFYYLYKKAFHGTLVLTPDSTGPARVYFREGLAVRCDLSTSEDVLGRVLLEAGWISQDAFNSSLQELAKGQRLQGEILRELGALDEETLVAGLRVQLRRKLNRLFFLSNACFSLYPAEHGFGREGEAARVRADPLWIIYQGVRNGFDSERLSAELFRLKKMVVHLRPDFEKVRGRYGFAEEDTALVMTLHRGALSLERVYAISDLNPVRTQMLLYTLWVTEVLLAQPIVHEGGSAAPSAAVSRATHAEPSPERTAPAPDGADAAILVDRPVRDDEPQPSPARSQPPSAGRAIRPERKDPTKRPEPRGSAEAPQLKGLRDRLERATEAAKQQNHFEVLQVDRSAGTEQIRDAYYGLAKSFHPDRLAALGANDLVPIAEDLFRRINEAHSVLVDGELRAEYEAKLDDPSAGGDAAHAALAGEFAFQKGMVLFRKKQWVQALAEFKEAISHSPDEGEHHAWAAWAAFNDPQTKRAQALPGLKAQLLKATQLSPRSAQCHYLLGEIYLAMEEPRRAITCFNKTLELQPNHVEAARHIRIISMRRDKEKERGGSSGLLKRFRKR